MSKLFKPSTAPAAEVEDAIEDPATMPDEEDVATARKRRRPQTSTSGRSSTRRASQQTSTGREYSRGTLG